MAGEAGSFRRTLLFLSNPGLKPWRDAQRLKQAIKERVPCVRSVNVRISRSHIEVDAIHNCLSIEGELDRVLDGVEVIYYVLDKKASGPVSVEGLMGEARYWEAHEALEDIYYRSGRDERVRALLIAAAAAAKAQEGLIDGARRLLGRISRSVVAEGLLDLDCLYRTVESVWREGSGDILACFERSKLCGVKYLAEVLSCGGEAAKEASRD
ncbi:hypothetical protein APE_1690.1 [Aeropyrum pernix K1]|uniref:DUF309 domain-containing protein n=1 Tax=Aeropyrum pernix (strain ATCC 700893 / DSM 11879 / JCM 9820 / NBRC 100138 / K1) TaxID=272557 RepID=Q9YBA7_AERPE|nr:DUF309 domain-containing protein [Aeropyrum pernix]BAA80691.2 hypothetical protein APE_1690.1 [Aeropyrum pernix K1]